jgi:hypothetical protein
LLRSRTESGGADALAAKGHSSLIVSHVLHRLLFR